MKKQSKRNKKVAKELMKLAKEILEKRIYNKLKKN